MQPQDRARAALSTLFVADALAMPVHWFYNRHDILKAFPGGVQGFEAAPTYHPSSIMNLHSTSRGGRGGQGERQREVVGEVILKGKRAYWGQPNMHYHQGMQAGENTLNAHCARLLMRCLAAQAGEYQREAYAQAYIGFMTADPPAHGDTYAESYHRGFFANLDSGKTWERCAAVTHDTPSIGGLVSIAPLVFAERLRGTALDRVQQLCREHLFLTHPDDELARVCAAYVDLLDALLYRQDSQSALALIIATAQRSGIDLSALLARGRSDAEVVGGVFSSACYISGSWPSVLYLAARYLDNPLAGLQANCNVGGDNVHRGAVLGTLLGLVSGQVPGLFEQLVAQQAIASEISALVEQVPAPLS
ncbi:MAG: ADP-ribosylglycohydrolase family protein [Gammaproteobacteria bacterium HGW-Gammaproteobacteria-11]|nr:MAG: ADP-ribosylglycohydrolase family protein [Gammaproteobacteria bacterium HGW-Gammaproteobacteria-11]